MDRRRLLLAAPAALIAGCTSMPGTDGPTFAAPVFRRGDRWTYECTDGYRAPLTWTETHEVVTVDASGISFRITGTGALVNFVRTERLSAPGALLEGSVYANDETRHFEMPLTLVQFPLVPGAIWNQFVTNYLDDPPERRCAPSPPGGECLGTALRHDEKNRRKDVVNRYVDVGRHESVTTPAGTFDTIVLRILMNLDINDPVFWPAECNYRVWWAEAAGAMVRQTKFATHRERGQGYDGGSVITQHITMELTSFARRR